MKKLIKAMKTIVSLGAVASLLAISLPSVAGAVARNVKDPSSREVILPAYVGAKVCRVDNTTTSKQCDSGSGVLYALCAYGTVAVAGKGSVAFDTVTAADIASFASLLAISPIVYGTNAAALTGNDAVMPKCWAPPIPARYESGLAVKQDDSGHDTLAFYRPDDGVNP